MKVPFQWLKEFVSLNMSPEKVADALTVLGLEVEGIIEAENGPVFEISLTPNLGHCLSIVGIARELCAYFELPLQVPKTSFEEDSSLKIDHLFSVEIENPALCSRYVCRYLANVQVRESPKWLQTRLAEMGLPSINNVVDIGNYVMFETGQPLHMFDASKIRNRTICVRAASSAGTLMTLDGKLHEYPIGTILICDIESPLAIAGIMGSQASAIHETTTEILIESAHFSPQAIRMASKKMHLRTDASHRFERGTDVEATVYAADRAAQLLQEVSGGSIAQGRIVKPEQNQLKAHRSRREVALRMSRTNQLLGISLSQNEVLSLLKRLQMDVLRKNDDILQVSIPSFRNDLHIEEDLIEEVARIYGYNNIPRSPERHISAPFGDAPIFLFEERARHLLVSQGLQECMTCDLMNPSQAAIIPEKDINRGSKDEISPIHVLHPSSIDQSVLRASLLPGLLQVVQLNRDFGTKEINAFEIGKVHYRKGEQFQEKLVAAILLTGRSSPYHWNPKPREVDFFDLKGIVENFLSGLQVEEATFEPSHLPIFHPYTQATLSISTGKSSMEKQLIGRLGALHPEVLESCNLRSPVFFAELDLHKLFPFAQKNRQCVALPAFPGSERDWTISIQKHTPVSHLFSAIHSSAPPLLESFFMLDLYQSEQLGKDKKNITFRFFYRDLTQTIQMEIVEKEHTKLMQRVAEKLKDHIV